MTVTLDQITSPLVFKLVLSNEKHRLGVKKRKKRNRSGKKRASVRLKTDQISVGVVADWLV